MILLLGKLLVVSLSRVKISEVKTELELWL